uniref:Purine nucleoside phosphorylase n=1 Tax=Schistocephalus solidus TaxID=70667 RepID=A0A0X3PDX2_SCHSO
MLSYKDCERVAQKILRRTLVKPEICIICGSGLGKIAELITPLTSFRYDDIEGFPTPSVDGHDGNLIFGEYCGRNVVVMQGRPHIYEGFSMAQMALPLRVMKMLGVHTVIITSAAGGLNPDYRVGDIVILKDHINLMGVLGTNPLVGPNDERFGPRFIPLSKAYTKELRDIAKSAGASLNPPVDLREGIYIQVSGPCFETIAEAKLFRSFGADVVGMSTANEVVTAVHANMKVLAISLVTNKVVVDELSSEEASHEEVLAVGEERLEAMERLISEIIKDLP